ncbi:hypothetical protein WJX73_006993 [Symbiochloris irregularis]|uniref:Uncharacterized protein n=1 Tax=Symbiochloris irregularis TaxID=706552 RepID=A0AAW1NZB2_9CHLO
MVQHSSGILPLLFKDQQQGLVALRLTAQAKEALTEAYAKGLACSMRFSPDDGSRQELIVAGQAFPIEVNKQDYQTEAVRFRDSHATEIGTVTHRLRVKPQMNDAQRKRARERAEEAERDRKERKVMMIGEKRKDQLRGHSPQPKARVGAAAHLARSSQGNPSNSPKVPPVRKPTPTPPPTRQATPSPAPVTHPASGTGSAQGRASTPAAQPVSNAKKVAAFVKAAKRPTSSQGTQKAPPEAVLGAKNGGLRSCLVGLLTHGAKRKLPHIQQMLADVCTQVPSLRKPPTRKALTDALKEVAKYVAPGFYVLDDVIGTLRSEAGELESAVERNQGAGDDVANRGEESGTDHEGGTVSRTASPEEAVYFSRRTPSPPPRSPKAPPKPIRTSSNNHQPSPKKRKSQSEPPPPNLAAQKPAAAPQASHSKQDQGGSKGSGKVGRPPAKTPPLSPSKATGWGMSPRGEFDRDKDCMSPSKTAKIAAAQGKTRDEAEAFNPMRQRSLSAEPKQLAEMQAPEEDLTGAVSVKQRRRRTVLDASDDDSDGLGRAPEPLQMAALQLPAAVQKLQGPAANGSGKLPAASSEHAVQPVNDDGSAAAAPTAKGQPRASSSWEDGASQSTWYEEHLSRDPVYQPAPLLDWQAFQQAKAAYVTKLEDFHRLHRLRRKFDRQVAALTAAREAALASGDAERKARWEAEVVQLREGRGQQAESWSRAYWVLHKELEALKQVMGAYYESTK